MLGHARVIMEQRHAEVFGHLPGGARPGSTSAWMRALAQEQVRDGVNLVRRGRVLLRVQFCARPIMLRRVCSYMAIASQGEMKAPPNQAAQTLLQHEDGRALAAQYYREVHDLTVKFEEGWDESPTVRAWWDVVFDLGPVDQAASHARIDAAWKRKAREALMGGPRWQQAIGDWRFACATLARHLGRTCNSPAGTVPAAIRIGAFLGIENFIMMSCCSIKRLKMDGGAAGNIRAEA